MAMARFKIPADDLLSLRSVKTNKAFFVDSNERVKGCVLNGCTVRECSRTLLQNFAAKILFGR